MTSPLDNLDDLFVFLAVADAGSIAGGARALSMDASTASRRLARLEASLGRTLLIRSGSGIELSEAGERLLPRVREASHAVRLGVDETTRLTNELSGGVRVTSPTELGTAFLMPAFTTFAQIHPAVIVQLELGAHVVDLDRADADIALRTFRPTTGDVITRRLGTTPVAAFHAPHISPEAARTAWVAFTPTDPLVDAIVANIPAARITMRSNDLAGLRAAAVHGLGTAVLPVALGERLDLVALPDIAAQMSGPVFLAAPRTSLEKPRVRALWEHIIESFGTMM